MKKKSGKVYDRVAELLRARGVDSTTLEIATQGRGTDHLVLLRDEIIGEYNHRSKRLALYQDHGLKN